MTMYDRWRSGRPRWPPGESGGRDAQELTGDAQELTGDARELIGVSPSGVALEGDVDATGVIYNYHFFKLRECCHQQVVLLMS